MRDRSEKRIEAVLASKDCASYDVIELGLIRDAALADGSLRITMILTTPFCPYAGEMIEKVRQASAHATDAQVFVDLRFDPWEPAMMEEGLDLDWGLF